MVNKENFQFNISSITSKPINSKNENNTKNGSKLEGKPRYLPPEDIKIPHLLWEGVHLYKIVRMPHGKTEVQECKISVKKALTQSPFSLDCTSQKGIRIVLTNLQGRQMASGAPKFICNPPTIEWSTVDYNGVVSSSGELTLDIRSCLQCVHIDSFNICKLNAIPIPTECCFILSNSSHRIELVAKSIQDLEQWKNAFSAILEVASRVRLINTNQSYQSTNTSQLRYDVSTFLVPYSLSVLPPHEQKLFNAVYANKYADVETMFNSGVIVDCIEVCTRETPLIISCRKGNVDMVALCLRYGAKIDPYPIYGQTALHACVEERQYECAVILLSHAARNNTNRVYANLANSSHKLPLHQAVANNDLAMIDLLLRHGADSSRLDSNGASILHIAAVCGSEETIENLLRNGLSAIIDSLDDDGNTPLHLASLGGHLTCVRQLLEAAACIDHKNLSGKTPKDLATFLNFSEVVSVITEFEDPCTAAFQRVSPFRREALSHNQGPQLSHLNLLWIWKDIPSACQNFQLPKYSRSTPSLISSTPATITVTSLSKTIPQAFTNSAWRDVPSPTRSNESIPAYDKLLCTPTTLSVSMSAEKIPTQDGIIDYALAERENVTRPPTYQTFDCFTMSWEKRMSTCYGLIYYCQVLQHCQKEDPREQGISAPVEFESLSNGDGKSRCVAESIILSPNTCAFDMCTSMNDLAATEGQSAYSAKIAHPPLAPVPTPARIRTGSEVSMGKVSPVRRPCARAPSVSTTATRHLINSTNSRIASPCKAFASDAISVASEVVSVPRAKKSIPCARILPSDIENEIPLGSNGKILTLSCSKPVKRAKNRLTPVHSSSIQLFLLAVIAAALGYSFTYILGHNSNMLLLWVPVVTWTRLEMRIESHQVQSYPPTPLSYKSGLGNVRKDIHNEQTADFDVRYLHDARNIRAITKCGGRSIFDASLQQLKTSDLSGFTSLLTNSECGHFENHATLLIEAEPSITPIYAMSDTGELNRDFSGTGIMKLRTERSSSQGVTGHSRLLSKVLNEVLIQPLMFYASIRDALFLFAMILFRQK